MEAWTNDGVRGVVPSQYGPTRWQSKYKTLESLLANKNIVAAMCLSADPECQALHDVALTDAEWQIIQVG
jgi:hypothetical protein